MLKISYAGCFGLSPAISLLKCVSQHNIAKKSLKPTILGVKCHSGSSIVAFLRRSSAVLGVISNMSVPFWNHFYARLLWLIHPCDERTERQTDRRTELRWRRRDENGSWFRA